MYALQLYIFVVKMLKNYFLCEIFRNLINEYNVKYKK